MRPVLESSLRESPHYVLKTYKAIFGLGAAGFAYNAASEFLSGEVTNGAVFGAMSVVSGLAAAVYQKLENLKRGLDGSDRS